MLVDRFSELLSFLCSVRFSTEIDRKKWWWPSNDSFSVKSYHNFLNFSRLHSPFSFMWKCPVPLKVKIVVRLILKERLKHFGDVEA